MRPVALRDDCPIRSVGTDFHSILGHNAIGNAVTRLIAQGIQQCGIFKLQLNIAVFGFISQIRRAASSCICIIAVPVCFSVSVNSITGGAVISLIGSTLAGSGGSCLFIVIIPAVVFWILYRFRIQVDGITAAGGVVF